MTDIPLISKYCNCILYTSTLQCSVSIMYYYFILSIYFYFVQSLIFYILSCTVTVFHIIVLKLLLLCTTKFC